MLEVFLAGSLREDQNRGYRICEKSKYTSILSMVIDRSLTIPRHSKNNPDELLKYLLVGVKGLLPTRVPKSHSSMMQTLATGS